MPQMAAGTKTARRGTLAWPPLTLALVATWLAGAAFLAWHLNQGWVPYDDGAFAQSAQRVLDGQLPHRDFAELYTGGLTFLNAGVFAVFGENLIWLRLPMFVLFVAYLPCVYLVARRFVPPVAALLVAAFAVAWGPATYPAAVPSWYLLFLSVFGALALLRYLETRRRRWLVVAGALGGLSVGIKIVGVWYVLAALLFLVFAEQQTHRKRAARFSEIGLYGWSVIAFASLCLASVASLMRSHLGANEIVTFLVPLVAVCGLVALDEARIAESRSAARFAAISRSAIPFLAGLAVPLAVLALPYVVTGAVGDLLSGVFVSPRSRLNEIYGQTQSPATLLIATPFALALAVRFRVSSRARRVIDAICVGVLAVVLVTAGTFFSFTLLWTSARGLALFAVIVGPVVFAFALDRSGNGQNRTAVFLLLALAAFSSLVQFPFGAPIYFCYLAPLFVLAAGGVLRYAGAVRGLLPVAIIVAYTLFGFGWLDRGAIYFYGVAPDPNPQTVILDHDNASIRVTESDRATYRSVTALLRRHALGGFGYAGPDAPEVYYLAGLKNPTRSLFDILDTSDSARGETLLRTLQSRDVTAVAINLRPGFSASLDARTLRRLRTAYPTHVRVGHFEVRWKGAGS